MKTQYSDREFKEVVLTKMHPTKVAFLGSDSWQFSQAVKLTLAKFSKSEMARSFNVSFFNTDNVPQVTKGFTQHLAALAAESPIVEEVRLILGIRPKLEIPVTKFPKSTLALFFNPVNPNEADIIFTCYALYGRALRRHIRSIVDADRYLSKFYGDRESVEFLASELYTGNTVLLHQELVKLSKLAIAYPLDFIEKGRQYIRDISEVRFNTIYCLLRGGSQTVGELLRYVYKSIFIDKVLSANQVFGVFAQHYFIITYLAFVASKKRTFMFSDKEGTVFKYLSSNVVYDKCFKVLALKPDVVSFNDNYLSVVPSITVGMCKCTGPKYCGSSMICSLAEETLSFLGLSFEDVAVDAVGVSKFCPFQLGVVLDRLCEKQKSIPNHWFYFLTGDRKALEGKLSLAKVSNRPRLLPFESSLIKPLGVRAILLKRVFDKQNLINGLRLFQKVDVEFKSGHVDSAIDVMSSFVALLTFLNVSKPLNSVEIENIVSKEF